MDAYAEKLNAYEDARSGAVFDHLRSRLQATTAACVTVEAEPSKAEKIAAEEADAAIGILRLACPVLLDVYQWAPVDPVFLDAMGGTRFLRVDGGQIQNDHSALPVRMRAQLVFRPEDIQLNMRQIWNFGHNLLVIKRNDFQELLLGALLHFSKSMLKSDTSERLMYVITALEALFVREGEPIVQNLRERLAVMQGPALNERLKSLETITKVYMIFGRVSCIVRLQLLICRSSPTSLWRLGPPCSSFSITTANGVRRRSFSTISIPSSFEGQNSRPRDFHRFRSANWRNFGDPGGS